MKAAFREGGLFRVCYEVAIGPTVRNNVPRTTIAGVDERFLHRLLFGLIVATLVSGVIATSTALMTLF
jgi:hypothetical protein